MALKRVFMAINRGITDTPVVCVYPWEKPILEEIHGGNARLVPVSEILQPAAPGMTVKTVKFPQHKLPDGRIVDPDPLPTPREHIERMLAVDDDDSPASNPEGEWGRLMERYGMHPEIKMTVVEKVFGNLREFRKVVKQCAAGKLPDFMFDGDAADEDDDDGDGLETLTTQQLRAKCDEAGIPYKPKTPPHALVARLRAHAEEVEEEAA